MKRARAFLAVAAIGAMFLFRNALVPKTYTVICLPVVVRQLHVAVIARSSRDLSQSVRID